MKIKYVTRTDKGYVKTENEDNLGVVQDRHGNYIAAVCDGITNANAGATASKFAIEMLGKRFKKLHRGYKDLDGLKEYLDKLFTRVNDEVYSLGVSRTDLKGLGTTFSGIYFDDNYTICLNCGDSRTYILSTAGELKQVSEDHNYANELKKANLLDSVERLADYRKSYLTKAIGGDIGVKADLFVIDEPVKRYLVCTDGLYKFMEKDRICELLDSDEDLDTIADTILKEVLDNKGYDNISFIIIEKE